jgi:hypothetical protein
MMEDDPSTSNSFETPETEGQLNTSESSYLFDEKKGLASVQTETRQRIAEKIGLSSVEEERRSKTPAEIMAELKKLGYRGASAREP